MLFVPTQSTHQHRCRLPRSTSSGVATFRPACDYPVPALSWLHLGLVYLPSVPPPPTVVHWCPPEYAAYAPLSSCQRRTHKAPFFSGLHRLAVHDGSSGLGCFTVKCSQAGTQRIVDLLPHTGAPPLCEVPVNHLPRRQVAGQHPPGAATSQQVEDSIEDFSPLVLARTASRFGMRLAWGSSGESNSHSASLRSDG
jgi:hypothetical protein